MLFVTTKPQKLASVLQREKNFLERAPEFEKYQEINSIFRKNIEKKIKYNYLLDVLIII